jgi:hypothetical protein
MKLNLNYLIILIIIFTSKGFSQNNFQEGYFIKNNGDKVNCLIKDEDWRKNPINFKFKSSVDSEIKIGELAIVDEFSIPGKFKYVKKKVDIDISPMNLNQLNYDKEPKWENKVVYLSVLIEGTASLYIYKDSNLKRYFYNIENGKIIQLVYKKYKSSEFAMKENNKFRQQLYNSFLDCKNLSIEDFNSVKYLNNSLAKIILKYNNCLGGKSISNHETKKSSFNLKLKAGAYYSSISLYNKTVSLNSDFGLSTGLRFGVEGEIIFPFNNNKWGAFFGIDKNSDIDKTIEINTTSLTRPVQKANLIYKSLEFYIGARHYLYLNDNSKLTFDLGYVYDTRSKLEVNYEFSADIVESSGVGNFIFGSGFHYKKIAVEGRLSIGKSIFNQSSFTSKVNEFNLLLSYIIL